MARRGKESNGEDVTVAKIATMVVCRLAEYVLRLQT